MGSLGQVDPDAEKRAKLALERMEKMQDEIDILYAKQKRPWYNKLCGRN